MMNVLINSFLMVLVIICFAVAAVLIGIVILFMRDFFTQKDKDGNQKRGKK